MCAVPIDTKMLILTYTEVTSTILSTIYNSLRLDYEYKYKNKSTGQALVPKKYGVYKPCKKATRCVQYQLT